MRQLGGGQQSPANVFCVDDIVFLSTSASSVLTGQARGDRVNNLASLQPLTHEHSDKMIARSFDCPTTTSKRNCKLVPLGKAFGCIGNCDVGQCGPIAVAPLRSKAATV